MRYRPLADRLHQLRLIFDTPLHEGDERGPNQAANRLTPLGKIDRKALPKKGTGKAVSA
jgi:hypothetical protein